MALTESTNGAEHVLHGRGLTQHLVLAVQLDLGALLALAFFDCASDQLDRLGQVKGLGQVLKGTGLKGRDRAVEVGKSGHDDHGQTGHAHLELAQQVQARAAGHANVADQHQGQLLGGRGIKGMQDLARVDKAAGGQALALQGFFEDKTDRLVIVHDPDGVGNGHHVLRVKTVVLRSGQWNQDFEIGPSGLAFKLDQAMVLLHKGLGKV